VKWPSETASKQWSSGQKKWVVHCCTILTIKCLRYRVRYSYNLTWGKNVFDYYNTGITIGGRLVPSVAAALHLLLWAISAAGKVAVDVVLEQAYYWFTP